ncbi:MAG: DUF3857 domain-containing protein [Bacteroidales bacterium]|nr:DUF3857 domain-containing protein [Bacteroidales bacterium]
MKKIFPILSLLIIVSYSFAQKAPMKWEKISDKEKDITHCPYDSLANAVVLCDYATISYAYGQKITFKRHIRIKILNKQAFEHANIKIHYYSKDNNNHISKIKAQTINYNNNIPEITVIDKKNFFNTKIDNEFSEISFAFPQIKEESIIEYSYTLMTENFTFLKDWNFQREIPVLYSEIRASIREDIEYRVFYQGNRLGKKYSSKPTNRWFLKDLPAIKEEPFCVYPGDYIEKLSFQLAGYKKLTGTAVNQDVEYVHFMTTPQKVAKVFKKQVSVESFLSHGLKAKKIIEELGINGTMTDKEKYKKIHRYLVTNFEWNGKYGLHPDEDFSSFTDKKSGDGASVNYLFHMLLDKADINSNLFYISTVDNGIINDNFLNAGQFNHVINLSYIDEMQVFTDASCAFCPPGELPPNDLNIKGLDGRGSWIPIPVKKNNIQNSLSTISIKNNKVIYSNENSFSGITAQNERETIYMSDEKEYFENIVNPNSSVLETDSFKVLNLHNTSKNLITKSYYSNDEFNENAQFIYIEAVPFEELRKKVFISDKRELPIDFIYPKEKNYYINITIPEGYEIAGKPKQTNITLQDKGATFLYKLNTSGKIIQIQIKFRLNRTFYKVDEYANLKKFFELINEKCNEKIVLKKTE